MYEMTRTVSLNLTETEIKKLWEEKIELEKTIILRANELRAIEIYQYLIKNPELNNVYIQFSFDRDDGFSCDIEGKDEEESFSKFEIEIELISKISYEERRKNTTKADFINNEIGRKTIFEFFVGDNYEEWLQNINVFRHESYI